MNLRNSINTYDSLFFKQLRFNNFDNGVKHYVQLSYSSNILKYFNINNSVNYNERWYFKSINKTWYDYYDSSYVKTDTVINFFALRDINYNVTLSTRLYGLLQLKKGFIKAVRHVLTPSLSYSYVPIIRNKYYDNVQINKLGDVAKYSKIINPVYGLPSEQSMSIMNYSLANNIEMKVKSNKDSSGYKKVVLIENFTIGGYYNFNADSCRWSDINISGWTRLLDKIEIRYSGLWTPYYINSSGVKTNTLILNKFNRFIRENNSEYSVSLAYNLSSNNFKSKSDKDVKKNDNIYLSPYYINFDNKYNFYVYYTLRYTKHNITKRETEWIQSLSFSGNVELTPKWKVTFNSGYDIKDKKFTYTTIGIYRDLHCWEMNFNIIPFGYRKSYNFTINVKSNMLKDLKITKKRDWWDN